MNSSVIHSDPYIQSDPTVAFCGENFVVVWTDARFGQGYSWLAAGAVDTAGVIIDTSICIGAQAMTNEQCPDIAFDGDRCLVVWYNYDQPFGVYGRFLSGYGLPDDTIINVATTSAGYNVNPSISYAAARYLVVWADTRSGSSDLDILGQFLSTDGSAIGGKFTIATGPANQMYPQVCNNGSFFLVIWRESTMAIYGQWYDDLGNPVGDMFQVSDSTSFYRFRAGLAASPQGYLAAWSEVHNDVTDIYGSVAGMTMCEEDEVLDRAARFGATMFNCLPEFVQGKNYRIYDVCGRSVEETAPACGVYYLQDDNGRLQKIVIVR